MSRTLAGELMAAIVLQLLVLTGMVVNAALPEWTGEEIQVRTVPVDPRSLFRGNYARLNYPFSRLPSESLPIDLPLRHGEVVYVRLQPDSSGLHVFAGASLEKPDSGLFLRGRLRPGRITGESAAEAVAVEYGIEAFFAPPTEALRLERELSSGVIATLRVSSGGNARLIGISGPSSVPEQ